MSELKNIPVQDLIDAGIMSRTALHQYVHDHQLALSDKKEVPAEALLSLLREAGEHLSKWIVKNDGRAKLKLRINLLGVYRKMCLFLMEESDFMSRLSDSEQSDIRKELSALCDIDQINALLCINYDIKPSAYGAG